jgi:hypothetical protein
MQPTYSFSSLLGFTLLLTFGAAAQTQTIKIWPGTAPGSENWTEEEDVMKSADTDRVINVTTPTLTVYLPEKSKATGTGVVIAPGGAFSYLAIDKEGHQVHIYRSGGHGFGMAMQGTTSDHWIDEFYYWLEAQGLTKPAAK